MNRRDSPMIDIDELENRIITETLILLLERERSHES